MQKENTLREEVKKFEEKDDAITATVEEVKEKESEKEQKVAENQKVKELEVAEEATKAKIEKEFLDDKVKKDLDSLTKKEVETTPEPFLPPELRGVKVPAL